MVRTYQMSTWSTTTAITAMPPAEASSGLIELPAAPRRRESVRRVPLVDDPCLDTTIEELDLAMSTGTPYLEPPPLMARLFLPRSSGRWSQVLPSESSTFFSDDPITEASLRSLDGELPDAPDATEWSGMRPPLMARLPGPAGAPLISELPGPTTAAPRNAAYDLVVSVTLILLVFAGAAAGALVFHEQLSDIVVRWETLLK
jgi:hypothetical protein